MKHVARGPRQRLETVEAAKATAFDVTVMDRNMTRFVHEAGCASMHVTCAQHSPVATHWDFMNSEQPAKRMET